MDENKISDDNNIENSNSGTDFANAEDIQDIFEQPIFETEDKDSQAGDISEEFRRGYKLYNFRRPDKFSKEHLNDVKIAVSNAAAKIKAIYDDDGGRVFDLS